MLPVGLGMVGMILFPELEEPEQILVLQAQTFLPTILYIIFVGALVSAILSTVDSALLVGASLVSHNVLASFRPDATEPQKVFMTRGVVVVFGVIAWALALSADGVYDLVIAASAFGTAGVFVTTCFGLFSRGFGGSLAALASLVAGLLTYLGLSILDLFFAPDLTCYPYLSSLAVALVGYLVVALTIERGSSASASSSGA